MHPVRIPTVDVADLPADLAADTVLLDVREDDEWAAGHIPGAVHVPMMALPQRLQYEPGPITPDSEIVVVCKMGGRSAQVTAWLRQQGYAAANLAGGMLEWEAAGRPMESADGRPPIVA